MTHWPAGTQGVVCGEKAHLLSIRTITKNAWADFEPWLSNEMVPPLFEPILHPSLWRVRVIGLSTALGHPLFYWLWTQLLPQPYESLRLRLLMSILGVILLLFPCMAIGPQSKLSVMVFSGIFWITLPVFFVWMYLCNNGSGIWLASLSSMFFIYYHLTDWRIATLGSISGAVVAGLLFRAVGPETGGLSGEQLANNVLVLAFSFCAGLILSLSSSNLRREQLNHTLGTMGIMAHELRTPLATMSLIGDAIRNEAAQCEPDTSRHFDKLINRLHTLVRHMNHQIDMQISNARLMRLPRIKERVGAEELVRQAIANYPYRSTRERECVTLRIQDDFRFEGSRILFSQVIDNLFKNAFRSLAAASTASQPGDLLVEVGMGRNCGRIVITDRGIGMDKALKARIFQPFFSTDHGTGHGLGLAFCQRVVQGANGSIRVESIHFEGAAFTIELPVAV